MERVCENGRTCTYDADNPRLASDMLTAPSEVARIKTESTVLEVATTDTDSVNTLRPEFGVRGLAAELELSLLAVVGALGTRVRTLVPRRAGDTWMVQAQRGEYGQPAGRKARRRH